MRPFAYERATSAEDALQRHEAGAVYLGGGTNLVDLMRLGVEEPARLVDVSHLPHDQIELRPDGSLVIGAAVSNSALAADRTVREGTPCWRRPSSRGRPARYATWRPSAATCSSAPAAPTSRTPPSRATSGTPAADVPHGRASTATWRSWATRTRAWRRTRPTWRSRWRPWARPSGSTGAAGRGPSPSRICTGCPTTSRNATPRSNRATSSPPWRFLRSACRPATARSGNARRSPSPWSPWPPPWTWTTVRCGTCGWPWAASPTSRGGRCAQRRRSGAPRRRGSRSCAPQRPNWRPPSPCATTRTRCRWRAI